MQMPVACGCPGASTARMQAQARARVQAAEKQANDNALTKARHAARVPVVCLLRAKTGFCYEKMSCWRRLRKGWRHFLPRNQ